MRRLAHTISFILIFVLATKPAKPQQASDSLSFSEAMSLAFKQNKEWLIANSQMEVARKKQDKLSAVWYPKISATGTYTHLSNDIKVEEPLSILTDPVKNYVEKVFPNERIISELLDKIGSHTLSLPLLDQNLATVDINASWPVFAGGKRIYSSRIGKSITQMAGFDMIQAESSIKTEVVERYFGLRLSKEVISIREKTLKSLDLHYNNAKALEENGQINRAQLLFAKVSLDEAKREMETSRKDFNITLKALNASIGNDEYKKIITSTPLFINHNIPDEEHFNQRMLESNTIIQQLKLKQNMANQAVKIERADYLPNIALFGKQTLYAYHVPKNLVPRTILGVGFTWNIFDGLARESKYKIAQINNNTIGIGIEKAQEDLNVGVSKIYSAMEEALENVASLNSSLSLTQELVSIRQRAFQEGMATSTEVVDAELMLSKVKVAYAKAFYEYDVALIKLLGLCGIAEEFEAYMQSGYTKDELFESINHENGTKE
ncbi:TolC family protein [Aureibacter tunicatorum]|uniref:Outer membrane protein TolC n=1 Tax=Aureibacter tunicatorum TaxID=866807 RepID=A0AAE3XKD2_9BACT|nr:TolC family protein [Aureibacter tunicatorum]MDR6238233.1 outer membrane protein TolC [Aureibacter tunicatorum]BDD03266.1 membrane protein [Aureibacter tunicatorum]